MCRLLGLSDEEIKAEFTKTLIENETQVLERVAKAEQEVENSSLSSSSSISRGRGGGGEGKSEGDTNESIEEKRFSQICAKAVDSIITKGSHTFLCCVDGSQNADLAYRLCLSLMNKYDSICIFHAFCESHFSIIDPQYLPKEIRKKYESDLLNDACLPATHYSFHFEERYTRSALRVLTDLIDHHTDKDKVFVLPPAAKSPDFVVLGYAGHDNDENRVSDKGTRKIYPMSLGSTADMALRSVHLPCIIAKKNCPKEGPRVFVLAVNFSDYSKRGLDILLRLVSSRDTLELLFIQKPETNTEKIGQLQHYYEDQLNRYGPSDSRFIKIPIDHHQTVAETILQYVNEGHGSMSPDFLALSPRAIPDRIHSTITETLINGSNTSIILCKN